MSKQIVKIPQVFKKQARLAQKMLAGTTLAFPIFILEVTDETESTDDMST